MGTTPGRIDRATAPLLVLLMLIAAALLAAGCGDTEATASADPSGPPQRGGNIILGMDQEPPCLNVWLVCGGMAAASMMTSPLWDSLISVDEKGERYALLATEIPTTDNGGVTEVDGKMVVTMGIKPEAQWNDGKSITCADFDFTWKTIMNDEWQIGSRLGWDKLESVDCSDPHTIKVTFGEPYAYYLQVVGAAVLPKHDLDGKDFNTYLNSAAPVTSGPFQFKYWKRSVEYVLERNPNYWNKGVNDLPYLDSLTYNFIKSTNTMKLQLWTGEIDWMNPPPDTSLVDELKTYPRSKFQSIPGGYWENFAFQNAKAPVDDVRVRRAIAYSIDRKQLTDVVLMGQTTPLQSTLLPWQKEYYVPAWEEFDFNPKKAAAELEAAGWKRGEQYWEKAGKPLEFSFKSTAGNALREKVAQLLQQNFKKLGIKMEISMELPQVFFGQTTTTGAFQTGEWAWGSSVDPQQTELFACDMVPTKANNFEGRNNYRYCNKAVTKLLHEADAEPDVAVRAEKIRQVQTLMAKDMPLLPMYQRPETVAYSLRLQGIKNNPLGGQLWNVSEWWVTE